MMYFFEAAQKTDKVTTRCNDDTEDKMKPISIVENPQQLEASEFAKISVNLRAMTEEYSLCRLLQENRWYSEF